MKEISENNLKQFLEEFKNIKQVNPDPVFRDKARMRLMNKISRPIIPQRQLFPYRYAFLTLLLFILPVGVVSAAQSSLPGEPLYQVKLASEKTALSIAPVKLKTYIKSEIIKRRGNEQKKLKKIETDAVNTAEDVNSASASAQPVSSPLPSPSNAVKVLQRVLEKAPEQAIKGLEQAIESVSKPKENQSQKPENPKDSRPNPPRRP
jgi:hypothetical protein